MTRTLDNVVPGQGGAFFSVAAKNIEADESVSAQNITASQRVTAQHLTVNEDLTVNGHIHAASITVNELNGVDIGGLIPDDLKVSTVTATGALEGQNVTAVDLVKGNNLTAESKVTAQEVSVSESVEAKNVTATESVEAKNVTATESVTAQEVSVSESVEAKNVTATESVEAKNVTATGSISATAITATESVEAKNVTATGTISATAITATTLNVDEITGVYAGPPMADAYFSSDWYTSVEPDTPPLSEWNSVTIRCSSVGNMVWGYLTPNGNIELSEPASLYAFFPTISATVPPPLAGYRAPFTYVDDTTGTYHTGMIEYSAPQERFEFHKAINAGGARSPLDAGTYYIPRQHFVWIGPPNE